MAKPTNDLSDDQLRQGIKNGEYEGRDALTAGEILQRRHEELARFGQYQETISTCCSPTLHPPPAAYSFEC